ncbi:MAG: hypothetical protein IJ449_08885 [Clostridia bacterium]|nr:hypothetical protein [Clostridia bacterium]
MKTVQTPACPYCGSHRIEKGIVWGKSAEGGHVGLKYNAGLFTGIEKVYSDLCLDCGSVLRTYIKEDPEINWVKN